MNWKWFGQNKKLLILFFLFLIINIYFFFQLAIKKEPDLFIKDVSYVDDKGWKIKVQSNLEQPEFVARIEAVFQNGSLIKKDWPLRNKELTWETGKKDKQLDSVSIYAHERVDWDKKNNTYFHDLWSKKVSLGKLPSNADIQYAVDSQGFVYLVYSKHEKEKQRFSIYLEKFSVKGQKLLGPELIYSGTGVTESRPFIKLFERENKDETLVFAGWNTAFGEEGARLYQIQIKNSENKIKSKKRILLSNNPFRILEFKDEKENNEYKGWYIFAAIKDSDQTSLEIHRFEDGRFIKSLKYIIERLNFQVVRSGKFIVDQDRVNMFYLVKNGWQSDLNYLVLNEDGKLVFREKKVAELKVDYSFPDAFQIIGLPEGDFHLAWIETGGLNKTQSLNYIILNRQGEIIKRINRFVPTGGYCPGFNLALTSKGKVELIYSRYFGHVIFQAQKNTEVCELKMNTDLTPLHPCRILAGSTYYDSYPVVIHNSEGNRYLFWVRDKNQEQLVYYSSTEPEFKKALGGRTIHEWLEVLLEGGVGFIYHLVFGTIYVLLYSALPLLGLGLYNRFGKYSKDRFLFWLNGILFMFILKIYFESLSLNWNNPLFTRVYVVNLILLVFAVVLLIVYWKIADKRGYQYRSEFLNKFLVIWFVLDHYLVYLIHLKDLGKLI